MKNKQRKGFTIVELVIVIAIIAILAAVLIPTFSNVIYKAKVSKDTQLIRNLNTALAADNKEHNTMHDAVLAAADFGYSLEKIDASATDNKILWDSANDVFCYYVKGSTNPNEVEYIPDTQLKTPANELKKVDFWMIADKLEEVPTYSIYAGANWKESGTRIVAENLQEGFDVGSHGDKITSVTYKGTDNVVIRTNNDNAVVTVNNPDAEVDIYGTAGTVKVEDAAPSSVHIYGEVLGSVEVTKGHVVIESGANTPKINILATTNTDFSIVDKSNTVVFVTAETPSVITETNVSVSSDVAIMKENQSNADVYSKVSGFTTWDKVSLSGNDTITLLKDVTLNYAMNLASTSDNIILDLNGHKIASSVGYSNNVANGANLVIKNGILELQGYKNNQGAICVGVSSSLELFNVEYSTSGAALYPSGNASKVIVENSKIVSTGAYGIATNRSESSSVKIVVKNSYVDASSAIFINTTATVDVDNSHLKGEVHGLLMRIGNAKVSNSTIEVTDTNPGIFSYKDFAKGYSFAPNWAGGNTIPAAAVVMGDYIPNADTYADVVNVAFTNVKVVSASVAEVPSVLCAAAREKTDITFTYDDSSVVEKVVLYGTDYVGTATITHNGHISVNGKLLTAN